ncbi:MAG: tRNA (adenosine(37)-N6)-dimethylallyltransferase MiaA, partial [Xanthomonadales bacterium]|nr:tRNA (adenosine(37)-N6)-dimethylallyltransferase MiaA [Xanthomonadales bacterium]
LRQRLAADARTSGWEAMHRRLQLLDPDAAARIHPNDPQRIQRALEVIELTGRPVSEQQDLEPASAPAFDVLKLVVTPAQRAELHRRIEQRFDAMLDAGFLDEVRRLRKRGDLDPALPALRSVGYRQAWAHLAGEIDADMMRRRAIAATRQLAKRQLTWLRREEGALWYDLSTSGARRDVFERVRRFLETEA